MKDKVKRRRIVNDRRLRSILNDTSYASQSHREFELKREQEKIIERQKDIDKIVSLQLKIKLIKQKSKQLNQDFIRENKKKYKNLLEFYNAYSDVKQKRNKIVKQTKEELKIAKSEYKKKYETFGFKIRRWFFGMGKEFGRVTWADKKTVFNNLIIVIGISVFLAIVFLIIDLIFSII